MHHVAIVVGAVAIHPIDMVKVQTQYVVVSELDYDARVSGDVVEFHATLLPSQIMPAANAAAPAAAPSPIGPSATIEINPATTPTLASSTPPAIRNFLNPLGGITGSLELRDRFGAWAGAVAAVFMARAICAALTVGSRGLSVLRSVVRSVRGADIGRTGLVTEASVAASEMRSIFMVVSLVNNSVVLNEIDC